MIDTHDKPIADFRDAERPASVNKKLKIQIMIFACSVGGTVGSSDCSRLRVNDSSAQARQVGEFFTVSS